MNFVDSLLTPVLAPVSDAFNVSRVRLRAAKWETVALALLIVIAAVVRFWGLGNVGLHGEDEDTTALAALHILEDGTPRFPSGMFYARAIVQSYLIAGSVVAAGPTEWAIRLPSAICGVLLVALAYFFGRRFLTPAWNLGFVAAVALSPGLILVSQNARMYVFFLTCLVGFANLVFRWERTHRTSDLVWAVLVMLLALQFQLLAIFGAFIVFMPPLLRGDRKQFLSAIVAFAVMFTGFLFFQHWTGSYFPQPVADYAPRLAGGPVAASVALTPHPLLLLAVGLVALAAGYAIVKRVPSKSQGLIAAALVASGLIAQTLHQYHFTLLAYIAALVVGQRHYPKFFAQLVLPLAVSAGIALYHYVTLRAAGVTSLRNVVGALVGTPSIWSYLNLAGLAYAAAIVTWVGACCALWHISQRRRVADFWLFFALSVWLPALLIGTFEWYPAPRYMLGCLVPMLLCAFAAVRALSEWLQKIGARRRAVTTALGGSLLLAINPGLALAIDSGYDVHPDHLGAAQYIKSQKLAANDVVLAQDVLMQTYYLGRVNYWLMAKPLAAKFLYRSQGKIVDFYTATPVIGSAEELRALLAQPQRGAVYVIGTGELSNLPNDPAQDYGIYDLLHSNAFRVVFRGRDGRTNIWMAAPHETESSVQSEAAQSGRSNTGTRLNR